MCFRFFCVSNNVSHILKLMTNNKDKDKEGNIIKEDDNDTNPYYMSLNSSIMPDLSKMELMDAIALLENFGMKVIIQGKGKKINQSIKKG